MIYNRNMYISIIILFHAIFVQCAKARCKEGTNTNFSLFANIDKISPRYMDRIRFIFKCINVKLRDIMCSSETQNVS